MSDTLIAIVVDDDEDARDARRSDLEREGFAVVAVEGSDDALLALEDIPSVDLVVTDIHLGGNRKSKGGVALARRIRATLPNELPVVGYSGVFSEQELTKAELELFDLASGRGRKSNKQMVEFFGKCRVRAEEYHSWRRAQAADWNEASEHERVLARIRGSFDPAARASIEDSEHKAAIETALKKAGFGLRLLASVEFEAVLSAIPVWVRTVEDGEGHLVEAQIYGFPVLHTFASDEEAAISQLIALMHDLQRQLNSAIADGKEARGPARGLHEFLQHVLRADAEA